MSNVAADTAERRLRLRAEAVVALSAAPPVEIAEAIEGLNHAADAVVGAGLVPVEVTRAIAVETVDALYIRGVEWLDPSMPELQTGGWSKFEEKGAPERDRAVEMIDLPGHEHRADLACYFDRLVLRASALVGLGAHVDSVNGLRSRLQVSAEVLDLASADLEAALQAFDHAVAITTSDEFAPEVRLAESVLLSLRLADVGSVAALERWSDHWRLTGVTTGNPERMAFWTATADGRRAAGIPTGPGVLRFDPALSASCRAVTLELLSEGRAWTFEVQW